MTKATGVRAAAMREKAELREQGLKRCGRCAKVLPLDQYWNSTTTTDGKCPRCIDCDKARQHDAFDAGREALRRAAYMAANRDAVNERYRAHYAANRDAIAAKRKAKYWQEPERYRTQSNLWRARNLERAREVDRENAHKRWREDKASILAAHHRRRARRFGAPGCCTAEQFRARWDYYGGKCWICWEDATTMDHIIPLSRGGYNWPANLRPACLSCNSRKGARDWRPHGTGAVYCMYAQVNSYLFWDVSE